jgi:hypothetical protein
MSSFNPPGISAQQIKSAIPTPIQNGDSHAGRIPRASDGSAWNALRYCILNLKME